MDEPFSIIDRILTSKQTEAMEHLSPSETVTVLLKQLSEKEADILKRRFGLSSQTRQTLEEIGKNYKVTRERIRQIERLSIQKIRKLKDFDELLQPMRAAVTQVLTSHGGFLEDSAMLKTLLQIAGDTPDNCNAVTFLLSELLTDHFTRIEADRILRVGWKLRFASLETLTALVQDLTSFFVETGHPLPVDDFLQTYRRRSFVQQQSEALTDDAILAAVELANRLGHNPYGEYGLLDWGQINPRRMNDKIYLILKKNGKPLHFMEIAKQINETAFDDREAYPPTVHNELILDSQYVLVGRGIYALREWGYQPGVVADVIAAILSAHGHSMSRKDIVDEVLKQRLVKRNTIHLALTNRERFQKMPDSTYQLVKHQNDAAVPDRH